MMVPFKKTFQSEQDYDRFVRKFQPCCKKIRWCLVDLIFSGITTEDILRKMNSKRYNATTETPSEELCAECEEYNSSM